jgi:protein ImuB
LWGRARRGEVQAGRAALRIQALLGPRGVLAPVAQGGRDPRDRVRLVAWGDEPTPVRRPDAPWPGRIPPPLPATVLAERVGVEVLDTDGRPLEVTERGELTGRPVRVSGIPGSDDGPVAAWAGPWPVGERWWTGGGRRRAYLQVLLEDGPGVLVALEAGEWWLEGIYD